MHAVVGVGRLSFSTTPDGSATLGETLRLSNGGAVYFPRVSTTASAANAFLDSGSSPVNQLLRSTSSGRYKADVEDLDAARADAILSLRPVWYRSLADADRKDWSWYGLIAEEVAEVEPRLVFWGYRDEDLEEIVIEQHVPALAEDGSPITDQDGEPVTMSLMSTERRPKEGAEKVPDGVQYDRLTVLLISIVQRQEARIAALEERLSAT